MVYSVAAFAPFASSNELYFFQGTRFVHLKEKRKVGEVKSIHESWPILSQENMSAIDAVLSSRDGKTWFFSGDRCVQVDVKDRLTGNEVLSKNESITKTWPALEEAGFRTVDAVLRSPNKSNLAYFFSGEHYVVVSADPTATEVIEGPHKISETWPALKAVDFRTVDTVFSHGGGYCFFSGDQCAFVKDVAGKSVLVSPPGAEPIIKQWPVLRVARFY